MRDCIQHGFREHVSDENLTLQINSNRVRAAPCASRGACTVPHGSGAQHAYNAPQADVAEAIGGGLVAYFSAAFRDDGMTGRPEQAALIGEVIKARSQLLAAYTRRATAQQAFLDGLFRCCPAQESVVPHAMRIVMELYDADVLTEAAILAWYAGIGARTTAAVDARQSLLLAGLQRFVEWLQTAQEENDTDTDGASE